MQAFITSQMRSIRESSSARLIRVSSLARLSPAMERPDAADISSISAALAKGQGTAPEASTARSSESARISASVCTKPPPIE